MGYLVDTTTPAYAAAKPALAEAFDHDVVEMGSGGSVPIVPMLAEAFPGMAVLIVGAPATSARTTTRSMRASTSPTSNGSCSPRRCSSATWATWPEARRC